MSPSATPATQTAMVTTAANGNQARHQGQPSAISATPAMQSDGRCHQVPRLPRKEPSAPPEPASAISATPATQSGGPCSPSATPATQSGSRCRQMPRLPRQQPGRQGRQTGPKRATSVMRILQPQTGSGPRNYFFIFFIFVFHFFSCFISFSDHVKLSFSFFCLPNNVEISFSFVYRVSLMCS